MMLLLFAAFSVLSIGAFAQQHECMYTGGHDNEYTLNLTGVSDWTLELETSENFIYYTPCGNRMPCRQGNANYYANVAQYKRGQNTCTWYLSIDHHERATYSFTGASWHFHYEDGELCEQRNAPRITDIYYNCVEGGHSLVHFNGIQETHLCEYILEMHSSLACVPENTFNANCQWRVSNASGGYYTLDLSSLKNEIMQARIPQDPGKSIYFSPCGNNLHCYQQYPVPVMSMVDNHVTGTCDHYLSIWESGRVYPDYRIADPHMETDHWIFHYYNGKTCSSGALVEEKVRFFCDPDVEKYKVLNASSDGDCVYEFNIASNLACQANADIVIQAKLQY